MTIYILHRHRYWTEYLDFLLEDKEIFSLVASSHAKDKSYRSKELPLFDPKKHEFLLTPGVVDDKTKGNKIIFRCQHSPGFYIIPVVIGYESMRSYHPDSSFQMLVMENMYRAIVTRTIDHPKIEEIQYAMLTDRRVKQTKVDLSMYTFINTKKKVEREEGTALITMRWLLSFVEFSKILALINTLKKEVKVSIVIHPCTESQLFLDEMKKLEGNLLEKVYYNIPRETMIDLYDQHEFIVTDGSGSCYEAMLRGCKPLAVNGLYTENKSDYALEMYYDRLEEEFFPFQSYQEISAYKPFDNESFLKQTFPFLYEYTIDEAKTIAKEEILAAAKEF